MIRIANINDKKTIIDYNIALAKETEDILLPVDIVTQGVTAVLNDPSKGCYYVYELNGKVLGQLLITYEWSDWRNANFWWIQSVYVSKDTRKMGVFQELFNFVKSEVTKQKNVCGLRLYVEINNEIAKKTYTKLGMHQTHYDMYEWTK